MDLFSNLVHEFGHVLDLNDDFTCSPSTVMCQGDLSDGDTFWRSPFLLDQDNIKTMYTWRQWFHMRKSTSTNGTDWSSYSPVGSAGYGISGIAASFGYKQDYNDFLVVTWVDDSETSTPQFRSKTTDVLGTAMRKFDLRGNQNPAIGYDFSKLRSLVVMQKNDNNRHLYYATTKDAFATNECFNPNAILMYSDGTNSFAISTNSSPGLAFDDYSQRFYLVWQHYDANCSKADADAGSIMCQTFVAPGGAQYKLYSGQVLIASIASQQGCNAWSFNHLINYNNADTSIAGPTITCGDPDLPRNCVVAYPVSDGTNRIAFSVYGFESDGDLYGRTAPVYSTYGDASNTAVALAWNGAFFESAWRGQEVATSSNVVRNLNFFTFSVSSGGNISFLQKRTLTDNNYKTVTGPALVSDDAGTMYVFWATNI